MVDARGNHLQFPYHTQYPPIRIVESGAERVRVRNRALAPRPEAGEGGDGDAGAVTTQPLASQTASLNPAIGALTVAMVDGGQSRYSSLAQAPQPSSLDPNIRNPLADITITGPYYLPSLMDPIAAVETSYISPYPPLQQTLNAWAPAPPVKELQTSTKPPHHPNNSQPVSNTSSSYISPYPPPENFSNPQGNHAPAATSLADTITDGAFHDAFTGIQSSASSASTLQGLPDNVQPLHISQLEQLDFPPLDGLMGVPADFDPLSIGAGNDSARDDLDTASAVNTDWLNPLSWDDFPVDVDVDFDFDFTSSGGF